MTSWIVNNAAFQVILIAAISLIVFGWWGTVFLSLDAHDLRVRLRPHPS